MISRFIYDISTSNCVVTFFYLKMAFLLAMYLAIHNKVQFTIWKKGLAIHNLNIDLITMINNGIIFE